MKRTALFLLIFLFAFSCADCPKNENKRKNSVDNNAELIKVKKHYKGRSEMKDKAARFLISNLSEKYSYEGGIVQHYDTIFHIFDSLYKTGITYGDPPVIIKTWDGLKKTYGNINVSELTKSFDYENISSTFLIDNIDTAFEAWENSPLYKPDDFEIFCEYILPYRIQNEPVEVFRNRYYRKFRHLVDTASTYKNIIKGFNKEFRWNQEYRASGILWNYPLELPISKMELGHRGACRQLTTFYAMVMRACGLPVTIDRSVWANRSTGHAWNVMILDNGKIFPFDALDKDSLVFAYKPAKIFRKKFSINRNHKSKFYEPDEIDVTYEYVRTSDVSIPFTKRINKDLNIVICVFDNNDWRPVFDGKIEKRKLVFNNMASDVAYLAAIENEGVLTPVSEPFVLQDDGNLLFFEADTLKLETMILERKYPRFKRTEDHAWGMRRTNVEGAYNVGFRNRKIFFSIYDIPFHVTERNIESDEKFRFVRFNSSTYRNANFAEVEFYGKKKQNSKEELLSGKIIGYPSIGNNNDHPYTHAMDGNLETYFSKAKDSVGWVGLDLGMPYYITRVRYCPRSDTNFILQGDDYELLFWNKGKWNSAGRKRAPQFNKIEFSGVPSGTMYLLKNHSRGKEERIFTYVDGKQIFW